MSVRAKDLADVDVVLALLEHPSKLSREEYGAFDKMARYCQDGGKLSPRQREWACDRFKALGLGKSFDAENLASEMGKKGAKIDTSGLLALENVLGPKVMAPPPSSRRRG